MKNNDGFSMVELVIGLAIMSIIGIGVLNLTEFANKNINEQKDDIENKILRLGTEKTIQADLVNSLPGFNLLNLYDDAGNWFYAFDPTFECQAEGCKRELTISLNVGETISSKMFYAIVAKGHAGEKLFFNIDPETVFDANTKNYKFVNGKINEPGLDISKSIDKPYSPWEKDRILLLTSNIFIYDCFNGVKTPTTSCNFTCYGGANCNKSIKRQFKFLGVVNNSFEELENKVIFGANSILKKEFKVCRRNESGGCASSYSVGPDGLSSAKKFYEKLPFLPGHDNGTFFQPIELVRYYLERPAGLEGSKFTRLVRESAIYRGGLIRFEKKFNIFVGIQSIVFTRKNVSNPTITFKINPYNKYNQ